MADYTTENLELIVRYDGSKSSFDSSAEKAAYISAKISKVVFITGSTASNASTTDKTQHIWVSNGTSHKYLDMTNINDIKNGLAHIAGLAEDGTVKLLDDGANGINFKGANGISITISQTNTVDGNGVPYWDVEVSGQGVIDTVKGVSTDGTGMLTLYGVKNYAQAAANTAKNEVIGQDTDNESSNTIKGAKKHADKVKTDLQGTSSDTKDSATIAGAKKYADDAVAKIVSDGNDTAADDTIKGAKKYTDEAKESLLGEANDDIENNTILGVKNYAKQLATTGEVSIVESEGTGDIGKVYTFYQGGTAEGNKIGVINTPKELVVKSGQVVVNPTGQPAGTYIELTIQNQDAPLYINVADLVDVYTPAQGAAEVQLAISATNEISATIKNVSGTKIINKTITKDKLIDEVQTSLGKADSAYQKPSTGIPKSDLATNVQTSLGKADSAIQSVTTTTPDYTEVIVPEGEGADSKNKVVNVKTTTMQQAMEHDALGTTVNGVVPTQDIYEFLKARFSVKVVS